MFEVVPTETVTVFVPRKTASQVWRAASFARPADLTADLTRSERW